MCCDVDHVCECCRNRVTADLFAGLVDYYLRHGMDFEREWIELFWEKHVRMINDPTTSVFAEANNKEVS